MYLCVRQMTVIIENTTPMARPRSTLRTTTDSQVTTQTIYIKKHSTVTLTLSCQDNTSATVTSILPDQWVPLQSPSCWFSTAQVSPGTARTSAWGWWHWCMPVLPGERDKGWDEHTVLLCYSPLGFIAIHTYTFNTPLVGSRTVVQSAAGQSEQLDWWTDRRAAGTRTTLIDHRL